MDTILLLEVAYVKCAELLDGSVLRQIGNPGAAARELHQARAMMHPINRYLFLLSLGLFPLFYGCAAVGMTLFGVGAGVTTGTAVSYTLDGIAYRTFAAPLPEVEKATRTALHKMGMPVEATAKIEQGKSIKATAADREIEIELEMVSSKTTRMRTVAKQGIFFRDRATAAEIIYQTEKVLGIG